MKILLNNIFYVKIKNFNLCIKVLEKVLKLTKNLLINTNTCTDKCIENAQYKYFLKELKIQIVLMVKGLYLVK